MTHAIRRAATALAALALGAAALTVIADNGPFKPRADETVTTAAWWNHPSHHVL